jgi:hypothetical protein
MSPRSGLREVARCAVLLAGLVGLCAPVAAHAQQSIFGYQLGLTQSFTTLVSDSNTLFVVQAQTQTATRSPAVFRSGGVQSNTQATANVTLDLVGTRWSHALLAGVALGQVLPIGTPEEAITLRQARTTFAATAGALTRYASDRFSFALNASYALNVNGLLPLDGDGGVAGAAANPTQAGQRVGFLVLNQTTHGATARALLQLTRSRWDLDGGLGYTWQQNALFALTPQLAGANVGVGAAGGGTAAGAFVPATLHAIRPELIHRLSLGPRWTWRHDLAAPLQLPVAPSAADAAGGAVAIVPTTFGTTLRSDLEHRVDDDTSLALDVRAALNLRVPTSVQAGVGAYLGAPLTNPATGESYGLRLDTLIYSAELAWRTRFRRLDLRMQATAGVSQPILFQPGLGGATVTEPFYDAPVVGSIQPIVSLSLERRFDPLDLQLVAQRRVGVGGLGAAAVTSESASLTAGYTLALSASRALRLNAGVNASRIRSVDRDLVPVPANAPALVLALNADAVGALVGAELPLTRGDGLDVSASASYALTYSDPTVGQAAMAAPGALEAFSAHNVLLSIRATLGRGAADAARSAERRELDAFERDPVRGSPLLSARLMNQGRSLAEGTRGERPGLPPTAARDEVQAQTLGDAGAAKAGAPSADVAPPIPPRGTADDDQRAADEARAAQREAERRRRAKKAPLPDVTQGEAPFGAEQGVRGAPSSGGSSSTPAPPPSAPRALPEGDAPASPRTPPKGKGAKRPKDKKAPRASDGDVEVF